MSTATTRRALTWDGLTARDAWNSGDVVDVWDHTDDRCFRGIYLGLCECQGAPHHEIEMFDDEGACWFWKPDNRVTIRLVHPSRQRTPRELAGEAYEPACPACDMSAWKVTITPLPLSNVSFVRLTWPIVLACVAVWTAGIAWVVWKTFCS